MKITGATDEDRKRYDVLVNALKHTRFESLSGPQVLSVAIAFEWLHDLKSAMDAPQNAPEAKKIKK